MTERLADTISGLFLILVALGFGVAAQSLPGTISDQFAGPGFLPTIVSICLGVCGAIIITNARRLPPEQRMPGWSQADLASALRIATVAGATAAYNILLEPLGYLIITQAYLVFLLWFLKVSWRVNLCVSLASTIGTYFLFAVWLKIVLPMGLVEIYL